MSVSSAAEATNCPKAELFGKLNLLTGIELSQVLKGNHAWKHLANYQEVAIVAPLLMPNEQVREVGFGYFGDHSGLILVTDTRVLLGGRKSSLLIPHRLTQIIDFSKIHSVLVKESILLSTLIIMTSWFKFEIKSMGTSDCRRIVELLRKNIATLEAAYEIEAPPAKTGPTYPPMIGDSLSSEIERLADLHSKGALTEAEFTAAKAKLLGV